MTQTLLCAVGRFLLWTNSAKSTIDVFIAHQPAKLVSQFFEYFLFIVQSESTLYMAFWREAQQYQNQNSWIFFSIWLLEVATEVDVLAHRNK